MASLQERSTSMQVNTRELDSMIDLMPPMLTVKGIRIFPKIIQFQQDAYKRGLNIDMIVYDLGLDLKAQNASLLDISITRADQVLIIPNSDGQLFADSDRTYVRDKPANVFLDPYKNLMHASLSDYNYLINGIFQDGRISAIYTYDKSKEGFLCIDNTDRSLIINPCNCIVVIPVKGGDQPKTVFGKTYPRNKDGVFLISAEDLTNTDIQNLVVDFVA